MLIDIKELENINSKTNILLAKEIDLCATCLNQGLTTLRQADFTQKGNYYSSFFSLTIGIERLLKLIFIINSIIKKNEFPDNKTLKDTYSHNIKKLIENVVSDIRPKDSFIDSDEVYSKLIDFFSEYAKSSRYYNLNALTGNNNNNDPLHIWNDIQLIIKSRHIKEKVNDTDYLIAASMNSFTKVLMTDERDNEITDTIKLFENSKYLDKIQGYSVLYTYKLISYLVELFIETVSKKRIAIEFKEYFPLLYNEALTTQYIIKKKNWNKI